jgi:poly(3-hydroxybutyrate) depolymerase
MKIKLTQKKRSQFRLRTLGLIFICSLYNLSFSQTTSISVGGKNRSMFVYAPSGIPQNRPLVISLHGLNQDVNYQKGQAKWENVADTAKIVVVYPQGESNSWDISGTKDTDFILAIIENMVTKYGIDRNRVYVTGFSMGGMMSYHTANKIADKIAAIGPVSGYLFAGTVASSRPMPIIHVHGDADDVVTYNGVAGMLQKWRSWDGCPSNGTTTTPFPVGTNSKATYQKWSPCNKSEIVLITLPGKGHWHSNDPAGVMTTHELWKFFLKQSLGPVKATPVVTITSPVVNASFTAPATVNIVATATDSDGTISKVEFFNGTTLLKSDNAAPYDYSLTNLALGTYTIKAVATDNQGNTGEATTTFKVNIPQAPYNGTWNLIPGTIQAENYDVGGNGSAYSDGSAGNTGGATFRTDEDVDIENCTDAGAGYNIGYATAGEWLEYSVDVQKLGLYDISFRVAASGDSRTISLSMDDKALATNVAIPNTAGWQTWQTVTVKNVTLQAGKQILRLTIGATDYVNINYVTFTLAKEIKQEPYKGTAHSIPGRIEAEEYDLGGEGLAYHEGNTSGNQGLATLRNDEVDIETTGDVDGMYNVAYILKDEWLEYSVNVSMTRKYDMEFRVAKDGTGGLFHVEIDGINVTGSVTVPNTGGWQVWETIKVPNISLTAGAHIMKIVFDSDYMNFNYVEIKDTITGVDDNQLLQIQLYPNPFTSQGLQIEGAENFDYKILDINGNTLEKGRVDNTKVIGQSLGTGVYFLTIENQQNSSVFKVVKN